MKSEVYKRQVDTRDELLVRILGAAARVKRSEDQFIRKIRDIPKRVAKCIEADGGVFRIFIVKFNNFSHFYVINLSSKH